MTRQKRSSIARPFCALVGAVIAVCVFAGSADAFESVVSADGASNLVNKDVGSERWAIAQNQGDGTVTGNVFAGEDSEPSFVWCEDVTTDGEAPGQKIFSCWGADLCAQAPCSVDEWTFLTRVPLAESFFLPEGDVTWASLGAPVTLPLSFFEPPEAGSSGDRNSGLQITRDGARVLISKDLAGERWAITRDLTDGTVTGNVFYPDGRDPAFVFCDETDSTETDVTLGCSFAEEVPALGPIEDGEGNYFVNQLTGDDDNDGTQAFPFRTIEGALAAVPQSGGRIYVAGGIFAPINPDPDEQPDQLRVSGKTRVELFGSFNPSTWIRDRDLFPTRIEGGQVAIAIRESAGITIDGFTIEAADAADLATSSVGILIHESRLLTFRRNTIIAGDGTAGPDGSDGQAGVDGRSGQDGQDGVTCISPRSRDGGSGGNGGGTGTSVTAGRGGNGGKGRRGSGDDGGNGGGASPSAGRGGRSSGQSGFGADPGGAGRDGVGARSLSLDVSTYSVYSNSGGTGSSGIVGGGGGGGAGGDGVALICGGGGGGGGGGGSGGAPGGFAGSGGGSIGIVVGYGSDAEIIENVIVTGDGGNGGIGGVGGFGGRGGPGGDGGDKAVGTDAGGNGGRGGAGGRGGFGGSGAGGSSIGVLLADDPEATFAVLENNVFDLGAPGVGGRGERPEPTFGEDGHALEFLDLAEEGPEEAIPF